VFLGNDRFRLADTLGDGDSNDVTDKEGVKAVPDLGLERIFFGWK
jgi:hypothetical protein